MRRLLESLRPLLHPFTFLDPERPPFNSAPPMLRDFPPPQQADSFSVCPEASSHPASTPKLLFRWII